MKKMNWHRLLYIAGFLLVAGFVILTGVDFLQYDELAYSAPFSAFVLVRAVEFLPLAALAFILAAILKKRNR
ncbi:hypothetical protein [Harryflintia acetispora]|uniref:Uncharacterized protein n=1 Tax=Harryflintia acetispora TaxID=1849041 RepID=A0A9X8UI55_9FIRM|nr:hypothetical protein [Harryflintia acetispora]TCL41581.1 hypothetical protein EDD78_11355 [Harryflintia acetispora]